MSENTMNLYMNIKHSASKLVSYVFICIVVIYLYYQIYLASKDEKSFTKHFLYNIVTIVIPIILVLLLIIFTSFEKDMKTLVIFGSLFICTLIFTVFYFLKTKVASYIFNNYLLNTIVASFILIGLSIIFTIFSGTLRKLNGWTGFFINLLFYVPCLIRDFTKKLIQEYNTSSTTILILFIVEILLIIMYFLVIPIINNKAFPEKTIILSDPVMLNTGLTMPNNMKGISDSNFAVSMWIYLNSAPNTKMSYTKETVIYNYHNKDASLVNKPHIKISYHNNDNGSNDFTMQIGEKSKFKISLPLQKWNNFVINYVTSEKEIPNESIKTKKYTDGSIYNGQLKVNDDGTTTKNGHGKYKYNNGDIYEGQWKDDKKNGLGVFTPYSTSLTEEGIWENDVKTHAITYNNKTGNFSGDGQITSISSNTVKSYSGDIKDGVKHGYGKLTESGNTTTGYWINDVFQNNNATISDTSTKYVNTKTHDVDIFINGVLERSYTFKDDETPLFMDSDVMVVGDGVAKDGLYGSICNIAYYKNPLSQLAIIYNYNLLSVKNPPLSY